MTRFVYADELKPGDVLAERKRVKTVRQWSTWVEVHFDHTIFGGAYSNDQRVELAE